MKSKKALIIIAILCMVIISILTINPKNLHSDYHVLNSQADTVVGVIATGTEIRQSIPLEYDIQGIAIDFATYGRINLGKVVINVIGSDNGEVFYSGSIWTLLFKDNSYRALFFDKIAKVEDNSFIEVLISSTSPSSRGITIWSSNEDIIIGGDLFVNNERMDGDIVCSLITDDGLSSGLKLVFFNLAFLLFVVLVCLALVFYKKKMNIEVMVFLMVLGFGLVYMFTMAPHSIPDETFHFNSAVNLSGKIVDADIRKTGTGQIGPFEGHNNTLRGYKTVVDYFQDDNGNLLELMAESLSFRLDYFLEFIIPALGISFARIVNMNFVHAFYFGRMCNLLFFALCVYFSIRRFPFYKTAMGIVALFPMVLHQAASYSYDAFINGLAFVLIASIMKAIFDKGLISWKDVCWIVIPGLLLAPAKLVYSAILLLVFFIPKERFVDNKKKMLFCFSLIFVAIVFVLSLQISSIKRTIQGSSTLNWEGNNNYTMSYILEYPAEAAKIFFKTLKYNIMWYVSTAIGSRLSGLVLVIPKYIIIGFAVTCYYSILIDENNKSSIVIRFSCLIIVAIIAFLIMLSLFLGWTSNTSETIQGIQGRYFIPVIPLVITCFGTNLSGITLKNKEFLFLPCVIFEFATILEVLNYTIMH